jgi:hypothetical protein
MEQHLFGKPHTCTNVPSIPRCGFLGVPHLKLIADDTLAGLHHTMVSTLQTKDHDIIDTTYKLLSNALSAGASFSNFVYFAKSHAAANPCDYVISNSIIFRYA